MEKYLESAMDNSAREIEREISQKYNKYLEKTEKLAKELEDSVGTLTSTTNTLKNSKKEFEDIGVTLKKDINLTISKTAKILRRSFIVNMFAMLLVLVLLLFMYNMSNEVRAFKNEISAASEMNNVLLDTISSSMSLQRQLSNQVDILSQKVSQQDVQVLHESLTSLSSKVDSLQLLTIERIDTQVESILSATDLKLDSLAFLNSEILNLSKTLSLDVDSIEDSMENLTVKVDS